MNATDYETTDKNIVSYLERCRTLVKYTDAYDMCAESNGRVLSSRTDPVEKLRQRYGERAPHPTISFHTGGYLGLRRWFSPKLKATQPSLFADDEVYSPRLIMPDPVASFDIGYEYARREQFMKDHYGDRQSPYRYDRARTGYLVEKHVSEDIRLSYPEYWISPDNDGQFGQPCDHDFKLKILDWDGRYGQYTIVPVDAKSWSHGEQGRVALVRNGKASHIYIIGNYEQGRKCVVASGFFRLKESHRGMMMQDDRSLHHIEILYVILSMQSILEKENYGLTYFTAHKRLIN